MPRYLEWVFKIKRRAVYVKFATFAHILSAKAGVIFFNVTKWYVLFAIRNSVRIPSYQLDQI